MEENKGNILGWEDTRLLLRKFAIPSIIAMLVGSLYNLVDQIFIGQGVGYLGNAATNITFPFTTITLSLALLVGIGSAACFNLSLGARKEEEAARYVASALLMLLFFGTVLFLITEIFLEELLLLFGCTEDVMPYAMDYARICGFGFPLLMATNSLSALARADGSPKYSMKVMVVGAIINTILDPLFIFGFGMGMKGAALATVIGQAVSFIMAVLYIPRFRMITLKKEYFKPDFSRMRRIAGLGLSNSVNQASNAIVIIVLNNLLAYYGSLTAYGSDIPLAASGIIFKLNSIMISIVVGINQGNQPILSFNYGARQYGRVRRAYFNGITAATMVTATYFVVMNLFPVQIINIFGKGNSLYTEFAVRFLRFFILFSIFAGMQILSSNYFAAIGYPLKGVLLSLTRQIIFLLPLIVILPMFFGLDGILYATPISDLAAFLLALYLISKDMKRLKRLEKEE